MASQLLLLAAILWAAGALLGLGGALALSRGALALGAAAGIVAAIAILPEGSQLVIFPGQLVGEAVAFRIEPQGLWLMGFGLVPAGFACALASPASDGQRGWLFGAGLSLIGALGVFGLQNGAALLVAWEALSLGGAVMILSDKLERSRGRTILFMLALLEVGAVALVLAVTILGMRASSLDFAQFVAGASGLSRPAQIGIGLLFLIGFGAKLGLLPFYEWFPGAYGSGSGASGAIMSGVVLNAAFFALSRALINWLPPSPGGAFPTLSLIVVVIGVFSAILTILYAFQQDDWRRLLSFSSAENASIAVVALGAAMLFRSFALNDLAGLAWTVALLHLAGHALAKGALFLAADGIRQATGGYRIAYGGAGGNPLFGVGALLAAMSLAAMPPTAGFVSEWFVFQTVFQGFHLPHLGSRLVLALTGAGLAFTAAVAFATCVKLIGLGVLSREAQRPSPLRRSYSFSVGALGLAVLALGVGMPLWLDALNGATFIQFGAAVAARMHDGPLLVPLTAKFAFISPSLLIVAMPLLALLPIILIVASKRRPLRRAPVWYGGLSPDPARASTTPLSFSNAMRTFYSFVYRPTAETERDADAGGYFVKKLVFEHDVAPIFGRSLFQPAERAVQYVARQLRPLQSGNLNFYLGMIGSLLVLVLGLTLI
ncbi:proton-conducting transporter membrane subunit [Rhodoblastus sp.]|uniref:proton-conducting transporter transmembrane domain-containing protein n=1 Tax=Rhodoblastus sp. TaxID=1962975 RepID=UPI002627EA9A|nr:proton-conducting transporter membrane subunit [Rhodoblastus sp.]